VFKPRAARRMANVAHMREMRMVAYIENLVRKLEGKGSLDRGKA
jgi:hypothetical protein